MKIGILQKATDAKIQTGVGQEKEALSLVWNSCMINKTTQNEEITDIELKNALNNNGYNNASVNKSGNKFKVTFESGNIYTITNDGNIQKYEKVEPTAIYAKFYITDGILILSSTDYTDETLGEYIDYNDVSQKVNYYSEGVSGPPTLKGEYPGWINGSAIYYPGGNNKIKKVIIHDKIAPTNTSYWFVSCAQLNEIEGLEKMDTSNVTDMQYMFAYCQNLIISDLSSFDTSNVTNMDYMFYVCSKIETLNLSSFDTSNVITMRGMFSDMRLQSLDLKNFNTSKVTSMQNIFSSCINLTSLNINGFDTSQVTNMSGMFFRNVTIKFGFK